MGKLKNSRKDMPGKERLRVYRDLQIDKSNTKKNLSDLPRKELLSALLPELRARWKFSPNTVLLAFAFRQHFLWADLVHHLKNPSRCWSDEDGTCLKQMLPTTKHILAPTAELSHLNQYPWILLNGLQHIWIPISELIHSNHNGGRFHDQLDLKFKKKLINVS